MGSSKYFVAAGIVAGGLTLAHGEYWDVKRNDQGEINGVDFFTPDSKALDVNVDVAAAGAIVGVDVLEESLSHAGVLDPWCSEHNTLLVNNGEKVSVCLDEQNLRVMGRRIVAFMRTDPIIPQQEGNPSLYLTYEQEALLASCVAAKEEMRDEFMESLAGIVGANAVNYSIEIHVDPREMTHPCDDEALSTHSRNVAYE